MRELVPSCRGHSISPERRALTKRSLIFSFVAQYSKVRHAAEPACHSQEVALPRVCPEFRRTSMPGEVVDQNARAGALRRDHLLRLELHLIREPRLRRLTPNAVEVSCTRDGHTLES